MTVAHLEGAHGARMHSLRLRRMVSMSFFRVVEDICSASGRVQRKVHHSLGARLIDGLQGGQASIKDYKLLRNVMDGIVG